MENVTAMYQQASPFGDKRQFVGIIPSPFIKLSTIFLTVSLSKYN